jgi:hypothetical protein
VRVHNHAVLVVDRAETTHVPFSHKLTHFTDELGTLTGYRVYSLLCNGRVSDALEEFDAFFSFKFLKMAILFDKVLFLHSHLSLHVIIRRFG